MKRILLLVSILAAGLMLCSSTVQATSVGWEFDGSINGMYPAGQGPWLRATFTDDASSGGVLLELDVSNLSPLEYVGEWYFNINPNLESNLASLNIKWINGVAPLQQNIGTKKDPLLVDALIGADAFKAPGNIDFDILISFPSTDNTLGVGGKSVGTKSYFQITGNNYDFDAEDFAFLCDGIDGPVGYFAVAKVQGIPNAFDPSKTVSSYVAPVPEPATMLLFGSGLIGLAAFGRKKFFKGA